MNIQRIDAEVAIMNKQLIDEYGIDTVTSNPMFRIVWNTDQMEKVHGTFIDRTPSGIFIREVTESRIVHKYRGFKLDRYVLERLVLVPEQQRDILLGLKISYEGLWTFSDQKGNYLPPVYKAAKFIIDSVLSAQSVMKKMINPNDKSDRVSMRKYLEDDPERNEGEALEYKKKQADELMVALFGNDSGLMGDTVDESGSTIIVPTNYERN